MISIRAARPEDAATLAALGAVVGREPEAWLLNTDGGAWGRSAATCGR